LGSIDLTGLMEIVILTKSDLIKPDEVERQIKNFKEKNLRVIVISSVTYRNIDSLKDLLIESNESVQV